MATCIFVGHNDRDKVKVPDEDVRICPGDTYEDRNPSGLMNTAGLTERDCILELAVQLYASRRLPYGQALRLSGLDRRAFHFELARRDISLYTLDDLQADVRALKELGRL